MMGTRASMAATEAVRSVAALRGRSFWRTGAVFWSLHGFALAVYISAIVCAIRRSLFGIGIARGGALMRLSIGSALGYRRFRKDAAN
jgi:hypothetical protein